MNLFRSGLKSVLPASQTQQDEHQTAATTVEKLVERVESSTLLEDRRDAVRALKSLSKKFCLEVGAQAMDVLINVLHTDHGDLEIIAYTLDTLCNVMGGRSDEDELDEAAAAANSGGSSSSDDLASQFSEIFIKRGENLAVVLGYLEEYEFQVRHPAIRLLRALLHHRQRDVQDQVLASPMGTSRIIDLISDSREPIRNEGLLLLTVYTRQHANIQKIIVFENAFDRILDIIAEEGYSDGGVVAHDCANILMNLLKNNVSNQNFFRESGFIRRLLPFFQVPQAPLEGWPMSKNENMQAMLEVCRTLIVPSNPALAITASQNAMRECGLVKLLHKWVTLNNLPADTLAVLLNTVGEVMRCNAATQQLFSSLQIELTKGQTNSSVVGLLKTLFNERHPLYLRLGCLYCIQCYLHQNKDAQERIMATLLPKSADARAETEGQVLCCGLYRCEPLSNWFAAIMFMYLMKESGVVKEQCLSVRLATTAGNPPVSLLQLCMNLAQPSPSASSPSSSSSTAASLSGGHQEQAGQVQRRLGLLQLLSVWLAGCRAARMGEENENLMILLSDLDEKCKRYKWQVRSLGYPVSEDEDGDDDGGDGGDDDGAANLEAVSVITT